MAGSTVHVTNFPPPPEGAGRGLEPGLAANLMAFAENHTGDEQAKNLISQLLDAKRPELALMVLLVAKD